MDLIEFLKERWYLIVGIIGILGLFLPYFNYYSIHKTDPTQSEYMFLTLLFTYTESGFQSIFENAGYFGFELSLSLIMVIIGAALLIVSGVLTNNEMIGKILPGIGLACLFFGMILTSSSYMISISEASTIFPFYFAEGSTRIYICFYSIQNWLVFGFGSIGIYKYLFTSPK